ncbi:MAG TPA: acyltransferase family protein [Pseudoxanthomonas sp.]
MPKQVLALPVRRIHSLDGLRSGLMLLGVVLHSAYPYSDGARWLVRDPQRNPFFQALTQGIHLFRMPAFFLIAGYFATLLLRQSNATDFLRERLRRIGVPLLSTLFTLNLLQTWLLQKRPAAHPWLPSGEEVQVMWSSGNIVGHLWFLVYLLVFCTLAAAGAASIKRFTLSRWPTRLATRAGFATLLGLAMACSFGAVVMSHLAPAALSHEYLGLVDPSELLTYLPFFCVGLLLETNEALLLRFSSPGPYTSLTGLAAFAAMTASTGLPGLAGKSLHLLASTLLVWVVIRMLFSAFRRIASEASSLFRYLSDASYSIYLMHHLIVVALASWLLTVHWGAWLKFGVVLSVSVGLSLAIHHFLILRHPLLRFLFNGKSLGCTRTNGLGIQPAG